MPPIRRLLTAALVVAFVFCGSPAASAATRYDPRLNFRVLRTAHFSIYWHQGEEVEADRLATIAEEVRAAMQPELGVAPARVHVILVDQSDLSNGWATPLPWDAIEITARPPALSSSIGNTTDWLRLVFTHEYTHILHLDRSRGIMRGVRDVFGRVPLAFSNTFLPVWQVEGIATFEESRQTGEGRVASGDFRVIVDGAARAGRFDSYARVAGGLDRWPAGNGSYAYGAYFHRYLAERFGADRIAALRDATAGRLPYFGSGAFRRVFGESLGDLWNDFRASRAAAATTPSETDAHATQLTHHHFEVTALTVSNDHDVFYGVTTPDGYPSLMRLTPGTEPARVAWRYAGDRTTVHGTWVVFDQVAPVRSVAWYSDLYAVSTNGGPVHRLTRETRAAEPAFSPDGTRLACVIERSGRRALATVAFDPGQETTPSPLLEDAESDYGSPQWSPDGAHILAVRRHHGRFEVVDVDVATRSVNTLFASTHRLDSPMWSGRAVVFSAELPDQASNVFAFDADRHMFRRVTDSLTGAREPRLSPDARTLYYIGYTPDGAEIFSVRADQRDWPLVDASAVEQPRTAAPATAASSQGGASSSAYSPWETLKPTYWTPVVYTDGNELDVGAGTAMTDVLGFHAYAAQAAWSSRARPDWSASYAYDRWRPTLFANYSDDTDSVRGGEIRSQQFQGGALLPFRRLRRTETLFAAVDLERDDLRCDGPCRTRATTSRRGAVQGGWLHDTRRLYGYSISVEEGHSLSASVESTAGALGSDVSARAAVFDARAYHRAGGQHSVLAVRGAAALSWGVTNDRRVFSAAGSGPAGGVFSFDRDTIGLLRGFSPDDVVATRAAVLNADFRFPIAHPEHGAGVVPVFFRAAHGAIFVDAGTAWDSVFRARDVRSSIGGELSLDVVLGHYLPVTVSGGAAWTRDPVSERSGVAMFGRIGRAF